MSGVACCGDPVSTQEARASKHLHLVVFKVHMSWNWLHFQDTMKYDWWAEGSKWTLQWTATRTTIAWSSYWIPTCNAYRPLSWPATVSIQQDVGSGLKPHKEHMKYSSKHLKWVVMFARGVMTVVRSTSEYMYILLLSPTLCGSSKISCYMVLGQTRTTYSDCGVREKVRPGELRYEIIYCL